MMNYNLNRTLCIYLFLAISFIICLKAKADMIKIKNGGQVEGIILEEDSGKLIVEIKYGKITLMEADIEHIKRASQQENNQLRQSWENEKKQTYSKSKIRDKNPAKTHKNEARFRTSEVKISTKSSVVQKKAVKDPKKWYDRPKLIRCRDNVHSYAAFLPHDYETRGKCPVLFVFDPGGDGATAVRRFVFAARDYGWIVIGSMDARNGPWKNILSAQKAMLKDVKTRYNVDQTQYYATGFSGGSRMSYAIAYDNPSNFKGIIGCGAGYCSVLVDGRRISKNVAVYHCVGQSDNAAREEIDRAYATLKKKGVSTYMNVFSGGHGWPPEHVLKQAIKWLNSV